MLTQQDFQVRAKRLLFPVLTLVGIYLLLIAIGCFVVWPMDLSLVQRLALAVGIVIPTAALILILAVLPGSRWYAVYCPACRENVTGRLARVVRTRRCPSCDAHIYEGRPRSNDAYRRLMKLQAPCARRFFSWMTTSFVLLFLLINWLDSPELPLLFIYSALSSFVTVIFWVPADSNDDFHNECLVPMLISGVILIYTNTLLHFMPNPWRP